MDRDLWTAAASTHTCSVLPRCHRSRFVDQMRRRRTERVVRALYTAGEDGVDELRFESPHVCAGQFAVAISLNSGSHYSECVLRGRGTSAGAAAR